MAKRWSTGTRWQLPADRRGRGGWLSMIELYTFATPNGQRAAIMLEELGLPYQARKVDLAKGEHKVADYLALNPLGVIPTLVDPAGPGGRRLVLTQSLAILIYLAEKTGRLLPRDAPARAGV